MSRISYRFWVFLFQIFALPCFVIADFLLKGQPSTQIAWVLVALFLTWVQLVRIGTPIFLNFFLSLHEIFCLKKN